MNKPQPEHGPRLLQGYSATELEEIAKRCEERRESGFIVTPDSVALFAEALRALARERKSV
ncbi:hypothetical protein [Methylobacterium soli]|uniref:Uncharacterized protein n=1 Tax=Methylobacterium soli TaxID=553447 RepID=A0A6L3SQF9_9HYPH|nr:hypothetical protein [Methylobacterium soli]KAB1068902.1 hypothetical protein F6X53_31235 [Methylobacterium soli]GJE43973.1 hypothetical protein AEGHOMDF_3159 [Methylobacterium soli]